MPETRKGLANKRRIRYVRLLRNNNFASQLLEMNDYERDQECTDPDEASDARVRTMLATATQDPGRDINVHSDKRNPAPLGDFCTYEHHVLSGIKALIGAEQVTRRQLEGTPAWIIQRALKK